MKKLFAFFIFLTMLLSTLSVQAEPEITVYVDGSVVSFDQPPVIVNDRTMVPIRAIAEAMGADVSYAGEAVFINYCGLKVRMAVNNSSCILNGTIITMDVPPTIINDRALVPLRALSESLQADVQYDHNLRTITITSSNRFKNFYYDSGELLYSGMALDGAANGYGTLYRLDGSYLVGYFIDGYSNGKCIDYRANNSISFVGDYKNGYKDGHGTLALESGTTMSAYWTQGNLDTTRSVYILYENQATYEGYLNSDFLYDGYGVYTASDGTVIHDGYWQNGEELIPIDIAGGSSYEIPNSSFYPSYQPDTSTQQSNIAAYESAYNMLTNNYNAQVNMLNSQFKTRSSSLKTQGERAYRDAKAKAAAQNGGNMSSFAEAAGKQAQQVYEDQIDALKQQLESDLLNAKQEYEQKVRELQIQYNIY